MQYGIYVDPGRAVLRRGVGCGGCAVRLRRGSQYSQRVAPNVLLWAAVLDEPLTVAGAWACAVPDGFLSLSWSIAVGDTLEQGVNAVVVTSMDRIDPTSVGSHELWLRTSGQTGRQELIGWVQRAVRAGDKVLLYQSVATSTRRWLTEAGIDVGVLTSGQVEILPAQDLYRTTRGRHEALRAAHLECIERAHGEGYRAVSLTSDGRALHTVAPDDDELLLHEQDLDELTRDYPLQVLCRYDPHHERSGFLTQLVGKHWRHVRSDTWAAVCTKNCVSVHGEIDIANADRLATVLHTATVDGIASVELSGVGFLSAQAVTVLTDVADLLHQRGSRLTLLNPSRHVLRMIQRFDVDRNPAIRVVEKGSMS